MELEMPFSKHSNRTFVAKTSDGTSHLLHHIKGCLSRPHQDLHLSLAGELETFKFNQEISRKALEKMLIIQEYPFCMVEHLFFREFVKTFHPKFKMIINFMLVPYPCTCLIILDAIEGFFFYWNLKDKLCAITMDNCTTNDLLLHGENHFHMRCCAQILNIIMQAGLKVLHSAIENVREIVKYVKASPSRMQIFNEIAQQLRVPSKNRFSLRCSYKYCFVIRCGIGDESLVKFKIYVGLTQSTTTNIKKEASSIGSSSSLVDREHELVPGDEDVVFDILCWWKLNASMYPILSELVFQNISSQFRQNRIHRPLCITFNPACTIMFKMCAQHLM
ncbi:hypothetical protein AMTRI_Chr12g271650 [Amborella trichopoda]